MENLLATYSAKFDIQIAWTDMNAAQHVNNVTYLHYAETARIEYFQELDFMVHLNAPQFRVGPIFAEVQCRYKAPLSYPDTITVASRIPAKSIGSHSFWVEQIIFSQKLNKVAAEIQSKVVAFDYRAQKKAPLPKALLSKIQP